MVQTIKAYKNSWKQTLKAYKSNMGTNTHQPQYNEKHLRYININQSIIAKQNQEFMYQIKTFKPEI